jgi:hypothetical protein
MKFLSLTRLWRRARAWFIIQCLRHRLWFAEADLDACRFEMQEMRRDCFANPSPAMGILLDLRIEDFEKASAVVIDIRATIKREQERQP